VLGSLSPAELDKTFAKFILEVRMKNGEKYAPGSLATGVNALMAHYNQYNKSELNFWKSPIMTLARGALNSELKAMQTINFKSPDKAVPLTDEEVTRILSSSWCDASNPSGLNHRLYILISLQLGCRISRIHELEFSWFKQPWQLDENARQILVLPGLPDKNHQGGIKLLGHEEVRSIFELIE
jgi:hypothetical protein